MGAAYFTAAVPEPYRILGLRLKPLSLGRYRLLQRFDVAFVADEAKTAGPADLILGLFICSMEVEEFLAWANSNRFQKEAAKWGRKVFSSPIIGRIPFIGKSWRKKYSPEFFQKFALFKRYIEEGSVLPSFWDERGGGQSSSAGHWAQNVEVVLRSELGWTGEEVNEQPLTKALSDYFKFAESQGLVRLISDEEKLQGEENAKILAEIERKFRDTGTASLPGGNDGP